MKCSFYGDDNVVAVSHQLNGVDMLSYGRFCETLGMEYTSVDKGSLSSHLVDIVDLSFLKRTWCWNDIMEIYESRLELNSIIEISRWSESDPSNMADQMNRFNSALLEISSYGKHVFDSYRKRFSSYCSALNDSGYKINACELFGFNRCYSIKFPELFTTSPTHFADLAFLVDSQERVVQQSGCISDDGNCRILVEVKTDHEYFDESLLIAKYVAEGDDRIKLETL